MKKTSIIVPVYNCELYLKECIDSILNQSYENIELLLIDDGSTDSSPEICDSYSINKKVKIFHNKNQGVSETRNFGLNLATGEYVSFVDSDDIIDKDMIKKLVDNMEKHNVELSVCNYSYMYKNKNICSSYKIQGKINKNEVVKNIFDKKFIRGFGCNKLFIREYIKKYNIKFDTKIKICEDLLFVYEYLSHIKNVYVFDDYLYFYRIRKSSATNTAERDLTLFDALNKMNNINDNTYLYAHTFYIKQYYRYKKDLKKYRYKLPYKVNFVNDVIFSKFLSIKEKIFLLLELIIPKQIRKELKKIKQRKFSYFE